MTEAIRPKSKSAVLVRIFVGSAIRFFCICHLYKMIVRMLRQSRSTKEGSVKHLSACAFLVCLTVYLWKVFGCPGFPQSYLCRTFTPECFLNPVTNRASSDDFTRLVDLANFTFLINNHSCDGTNLLLLVLVHSDPSNREKRSTIRSTWGRVREERFKLLFLLGVPKSPLAQSYLEKENAAHGDLVQGNFVDSYRNLTYKHVMALKWTKYFCPRAKYLLKTDDDIFLNSPSFLNYADRLLPERNLMRCLPVYESRAQRTSRSKWRVTWSEYKFRWYPTFCQGFAILYSFDVVLALYDKAQVANYFWIDDVFITGFMAMSANITPSSFGHFMLQHEEFHRLMRDPSGIHSYLLGPCNLKVADIKKLWELTYKRKQDVGTTNRRQETEKSIETIESNRFSMRI